jgi:hypothetical protein
VCKADKFKGCPCESPDFESMDVNIDEPFPANNDAAALSAQTAISLQKLWGGDPNTFQDIRRKRTQARSVSMGKSVKHASENCTDTSPEPRRISHESPRSTASVERIGQLFGPWYQRQRHRVRGARS